MDKNKIEIYKFFFPNRAEYLDYIYNIGSIILENLPIKKKEKYRIIVALSEAFSNSLLHGNKNNPKKEIKVSFFTQAKKLEIEIEDQGKGFISNNKLKERREAEAISGRGLFLMKKYVDKVLFLTEKGKGTKVILIKKF